MIKALERELKEKTGNKSLKRQNVKAVFRKMPVLLAVLGSGLAAAAIAVSIVFADVWNETSLKTKILFSIGIIFADISLVCAGLCEGCDKDDIPIFLRWFILVSVIIGGAFIGISLGEKTKEVRAYKSRTETAIQEEHNFSFILPVNDAMAISVGETGRFNCVLEKSQEKGVFEFSVIRGDENIRIEPHAEGYCYVTGLKAGQSIVQVSNTACGFSEEYFVSVSDENKDEDIKGLELNDRMKELQFSDNTSEQEVK